MVGCSGAASQETGAQDAVTSVTSGLTSENGTASELLSSVFFCPQDYGAGEDAFCEWYFDGADVEVAGVDVQGDSATVHVAFSAKRMAEVLPILEQARDQALADGADAMRDGYANERFAAVVENAQVGTDRLEIAVPVTRGSDGTWAIDDRAMLAAGAARRLRPAPDLHRLAFDRSYPQRNRGNERCKPTSNPHRAASRAARSSSSAARRR